MVIDEEEIKGNHADCINDFNDTLPKANSVSPVLQNPPWSVCTKVRKKMCLLFLTTCHSCITTEEAGINKLSSVCKTVCILFSFSWLILPKYGY